MRRLSAGLGALQTERASAGKWQGALIGVCQLLRHNGWASCPDTAPPHRSMGNINTAGIGWPLWQPGRGEWGLPSSRLRGCARSMQESPLYLLRVECLSLLGPPCPCWRVWGLLLHWGLRWLQGPRREKLGGFCTYRERSAADLTPTPTQCPKFGVSSGNKYQQTKSTKIALFKTCLHTSAKPPWILARLKQKNCSFFPPCRKEAEVSDRKEIKELRLVAGCASSSPSQEMTFEMSPRRKSTICVHPQPFGGSLLPVVCFPPHKRPAGRRDRHVLK